MGCGERSAARRATLGHAVSPANSWDLFVLRTVGLLYEAPVLRVRRRGRKHYFNSVKDRGTRPIAGGRAVEAEGLTTQQWAVLGALSHDEAIGGMSVGDLARYLKVSRMERDGHVKTAPDSRDRRSRLVTM